MTYVELLMPLETVCNAIKAMLFREIVALLSNLQGQSWLAAVHGTGKILFA